MRLNAPLLVLTLLLVWNGSAYSNSGSHYDTNCTGSVSPPNAVVLICPQGDTPTLAELGVTIFLPFGAQVPEGSIYATENYGNIAFCFPPQVDGPPDTNGTATFSGAVVGGGQTNLWLWGCGWIPEPPCLLVDVPIIIVSPDINTDLIVNIQDFSLFGMAYPPHSYDFRADFNGDSIINLVDFAIFAQHYGHKCE